MTDLAPRGHAAARAGDDDLDALRRDAAAALAGAAAGLWAFRRRDITT